MVRALAARDDAEGDPTCIRDVAMHVPPPTSLVAFSFHVSDGRVNEVELIADPEVLATLDVRRTRRRSAP